MSYKNISSSINTLFIYLYNSKPKTKQEIKFNLKLHLNRLYNVLIITHTHLIHCKKKYFWFNLKK